MRGMNSNNRDIGKIAMKELREEQKQEVRIEDMVIDEDIFDMDLDLEGISDDD